MRFGIVGTNFISKSFIEAANKIEGCKVTGVCSGRIENAERFAQEYNVDKVYPNYQKMIVSGDIDAVYVGVPNAMHYEVAMECLKHKVPVFCEKPMASNYREAKEMIDFAREQNTYLHHGLVPAYTRNIQLLKERLTDIAPLRRAVLSFEKYSSRYEDYLNGKNPTTFRRELSNGSLLDLGVYPVGVAILLFGEPKEIIATGVLLETGVDATGTCIFKYDGFEVVILHSKVSNTQVISEIQGEKGSVQIHRVSRIEQLDLIEMDGKQEILAYDEKDTFVYQIEEFIKTVQQGLLESPRLSHETTLIILKVLDECRKQMGVTYPADGGN